MNFKKVELFKIEKKKKFWSNSPLHPHPVRTPVTSETNAAPKFERPRRIWNAHLPTTHPHPHALPYRGCCFTQRLCPSFLTPSSSSPPILQPQHVSRTQRGVEARTEAPAERVLLLVSAAPARPSSFRTSSAPCAATPAPPAHCTRPSPAPLSHARLTHALSDPTARETSARASRPRTPSSHLVTSRSSSARTGAA